MSEAVASTIPPVGAASTRPSRLVPLCGWLIGAYLATSLVIPGQAIGVSVGVLVSADRLAQLVLLLAPTLWLVLVPEARRVYMRNIGSALLPFAVAVLASVTYPLLVAGGLVEGSYVDLAYAIRKAAFFLFQFVSFSWAIAMLCWFVVQRAAPGQAARVLVAAVAVPALLGLIPGWLEAITGVPALFMFEAIGLPIDEENARRILWSDMRAGTMKRMNGALPHPIDFAVVMGLAFALVAYSSARPRRRVLGGALLLSGVVFSFSRGPMLSLALAVLLLPALGWWTPAWGPAMLRRIGIALVGVVAIVVSWDAISRSSLLFPTGTVDTSSMMRTADYPIALPQFARWPLTGIGTGLYTNAATALARAETAVAGEVLDNYWLKALVETGVLGAGALLALFVLQFRRATRLRNRWGLILAVATTSFAIQCFFFDAWDFLASGQLFLTVSIIAATLGEAESARTTRGVTAEG